MAGRWVEEMTAALRETGALSLGTKILVAWGGFLVEDNGTGVGPGVLPEPEVAVLGLTARTGHVLSRRGLLSFDLRDLRGAYSPRVGMLRFSIVREGRPRIDIGMTVDYALAVAGQLMDWRVLSAVPAPANRRPPAKRRVDPEKAA